MTSSPAPAARNRYIDTLRAAAIVRVVVYHAFGWAWLTILLPAMGVMFAVAGSLMAASIEAHGARRAVTSRVRRLLPALWVFAAIAVPIMLWHGWATDDPDHPFRRWELVFWLVPISDPPGSHWGTPLWEVLWYLRAYLLFVIASPLLYFLYRRLSWLVVAAPLAGLAALSLTGFRLPDPLDAIMWDFVTYCACWVAGFAHRDGRLARLPRGAHIAIVSVLAAVGGYWLCTHPTADGFDINEIPIARTLWSLAFVLLVLRFRPAMTTVEQTPWLSSAVKFINARAVTIYLWHYPLIAVGAGLLTVLAVPWATPEYVFFMLVIATVFILVAVLLLGWVEDLSARRRPSLWPGRSRSRPVAPETGARTPDPALSGAGRSTAGG